MNLQNFVPFLFVCFTEVCIVGQTKITFASKPLKKRATCQMDGIKKTVCDALAKVNRHYDLLGLDRSCRIEYFNVPHMIHGVGTFEFLDRHIGLKP